MTTLTLQVIASVLVGAGLGNMAFAFTFARRGPKYRNISVVTSVVLCVASIAVIAVTVGRL